MYDYEKDENGKDGYESGRIGVDRIWRTGGTGQEMADAEWLMSRCKCIPFASLQLQPLPYQIYSYIIPSLK
jgi:hypothetical protein